MKKYLLIFLVLIFLIISIYYFKSDYKIKYKINKYNVVETYKNNKYYFEIKSDKLYNFDILEKRKISKKHIQNIKVIKNENNICIIPTSKKLKTYPLCYRNNEAISYTQIEDEKIINALNNNGFKKEKFPKDENKNFEFYNNLEKDEIISVWKYNGFYIMNDNNIKTINIFKKDRYSNDLCSLIDNKLVFANYDEDHEFSSVYVINVETGKYIKIKSNYNISYESYIAGKSKNTLYLFDKKYKIEYAINVKKETIKVVGDEEKGYIKYKNDRKESASLAEFNKTLRFNLNKESYYIYDDGEKIRKAYKENSKHSMIIFDKKAKIIDYNKDILYFVNDDKLYKYIPKIGERAVVKNYEWKFNLDNTIYIFNK